MTIDIHHGAKREATARSIAAALPIRRPITWDTRLNLPTLTETAALLRDVKRPS